MAKKSVIARDVHRRVIVSRYAAKRAELKKLIADPKIEYTERLLHVRALQKLPRDASPVRLRNRCSITGRSRGYYRKFKMCRNMLRIVAMSGQAPGLRMASW